jgi:hypothetical protein
MPPNLRLVANDGGSDASDYSMDLSGWDPGVSGGSGAVEGPLLPDQNRSDLAPGGDSPSFSYGTATDNPNYHPTSSDVPTDKPSSVDGGVLSSLLGGIIGGTVAGVKVGMSPSAAQLQAQADALAAAKQKSSAGMSLPIIGQVTPVKAMVIVGVGWFLLRKRG